MKYLSLILIIFNGILGDSLIQGQIVDIDSKRPISGVNVHIEGSDIGTATDEYGVFSIDSQSKKIKISHIAYVDIDYFIQDSKDVVIFLEPSVINSEELVITGTRTLKTFKDSPVLTRIISSQEIKDSQSRDLYDIMDEIFPGYQKLKGEHAISNEIRFNGLGTKSILFMIDGEKVNAEYGGNMDLSVVDVNNIEKIEYVDGAISTLYGSGAMGGAVNIITKNPNKNSYNLNVNLFSDNPSVNSGHISYMQDWGVVSGMASVSLNTSKGFNLEIENMNPNSEIQKHQEEFSNLNANVKINFNFNKINFTINHSDYLSSINLYKVNDYDPISEVPIVVFQDPLPRNYDSYSSFKLEFQRDESTLINCNFSTEDYEKKYKYIGFGEQPWSASYTKNGSIIVSKLFSKGSVLFGLDMTSDKYASYDIDLDPNDEEIDESSIFTDSNLKQASQYSIFINSDWLFNDINATSGLRYQYHDAYDGQFVPMLSLYKKYDKYKLRSTWSKGYRTPNLKELYYQWDMHPGGGSVLGNSNLNPEESEYISISLESFKDFYYSVNVYHNSLKNMINWIPEGSDFRYTNFEKVSLRGINIFYKRKLSGNGELTFSYNYLDAHDHILNARLNGSNFHNLNTKLTYFILDNLKTRLSFKYSSPKKYVECVQNCGGDSSDDVFELSSFSLIDFSMRYDFSGNISATLGVNNVFDYRDPNASTEQFLTLVNPGRTIVFSFDYNLRGFNEK